MKWPVQELQISQLTGSNLDWLKGANPSHKFDLAFAFLPVRLGYKELCYPRIPSMFMEISVNRLCFLVGKLTSWNYGISPYCYAMSCKCVYKCVGYKFYSRVYRSMMAVDPQTNDCIENQLLSYLILSPSLYTLQCWGNKQMSWSLTVLSLS